MLDLAREEVAHVLNMEVSQVPLDRSLQSLGLDSLMAVELAAGLEQRTGVNLPVMLFSDAPTLEIVAQRITSRLIGAGADNSEDTAADTSEGAAALASEPKAEAARVSTTQTSPSVASLHTNTGSLADSAKVHADQTLLEELARRHAENLDAGTLQDIMHDASQDSMQAPKKDNPVTSSDTMDCQSVQTVRLPSQVQKELSRTATETKGGRISHANQRKAFFCLL